MSLPPRVIEQTRLQQQPPGTPRPLSQWSHWGSESSAEAPSPQLTPVPQNHRSSFRDQATQFGSCRLRAKLMLPHFPGSDWWGVRCAAHKRLGRGLGGSAPLLLTGLQGPLWLSHQAKTCSFDTIQKMQMSWASNPSLPFGNLNHPET